MTQQHGDVSVEGRSIYIEWKIPRFFQLPQTAGYILQSPAFSFCNASWRLSFYPNGDAKFSEWLALYLQKSPVHSSQGIRFVTPNTSSLPSIFINFTLGIKKADCSVLKSLDGTHKFTKETEGSGWPTFIQKADFLNDRNVVDQDGTLRLFCSAYVNHGSVLSEINDYKKEVRELNGKLFTANLQLRTASARIKSLEQEIEKADHSLSENFKQLFLSQYKGDTTVRVGDKEFLVHKAILAARSPVFRAMFDTDMEEKKDVVVNIEDCELSPFVEFLIFLYSGKFDIVKPSNALKLCLIAHKYSVLQLKEACFEVMKKEMSEELVCEAVYLATVFDNEELLNTATDYFAENMEKVMSTPKWFLFLSRCTAMANELLFKTSKKTQKYH